MIDVANAKINSLSKTIDVSPNEEAIFVLTSSQLQDLLKEAIQPLQDEVSQLRATVTRQDGKITTLESTQEQDVDRLAFDICQDRQRLARLEKVEPQPMQKDRGDILRALLAANGGKMLAIDARNKMHLSKNRFSELLKICDFLDTIPLYSDKRKTVIILKSELVPRN